MRTLFRGLIPFAIAIALFVFGSVTANAQNNFPTPGGAQVDGKVEMCLNASSQAVPCSGPNGIGSAPYQFSPTTTANTDQHGLALTSATALTVPADAICANISTKGGAVNWRWDGTAPTGTVGNQQALGTMAQFCGRNILNALQFIQISGNTSTLDVTYSK